MAEQVVDYIIGADAEAAKKALREIDQAAEQLGREIGRALTEGGRTGARGMSTEIDRGLDQAGRSSGRTAVNVGNILGRGVAAALAAAVATFGSAEIIKALSEIGDTAKKTGLEIERVTALQNVGLQNGLNGAQINTGLNSLGARANTELREGEGQLTALLEANNLKITDREGKLKSVNTLLEDAARLTSNAGTEFDKIDIARLFGLTEEWVKILEQGPEALKKAIAAAEEAGGSVDRELVQKAQAFDDAWNKAWANWTISAKAGILEIINLISRIPSSPGFVTPEQLRNSAPIGPFGIPAANPITNDAESRRGRAFGNISEPLSFDVRTPRGSRTRIPTSGGGGGGGGASEADQAEARLERYTDSLKRQGDVLRAEIDTFGQSEAQRKAAIEIAKAQVDLQRLDAETRERLTGQIRTAVEENERYRETLQQLEGQKQAARAAAQSLTDALADIVLDGKNAEDVLRNLVKSFARQALNAAFAGSGSFAGAIGTQNNGGLFGSIFSSLLGGFKLPGFASGGALPRGLSMVGENGPEILRNDGSGIGRVYASGLGPAQSVGGGVVIQADFRNAESAAIPQIQAQLRRMEKNLPRMIASAEKTRSARGFVG